MPLSPPLTLAQLEALRNIYDIPARLDCTPRLHCGFRYNAGRLTGLRGDMEGAVSGPGRLPTRLHAHSIRRSIRTAAS